MKIEYPIEWSMRSIIAFIFIALTVLCTSIMAQETADYWLQKGNEFYKNDSYDLAMRCYDKAIEINPQDANAWYNKGITLKTLGRTTEADAAFAKAKDLTTSTTSDASYKSDADTSDADVSRASKTLSHSGFGSYTFDGQDEVTATVKKGTDPYHMMGLSELVSEVGYTRDGTQYIVTSTGTKLLGYIDYSMDGYVVVMKPRKSSLTKGEFMDIINTFQRVTTVELEKKITISPESRSGEVEPLKISTMRIGYQPSIYQIAEMVASTKGWWKEDLKPFGIVEVKEFEFPSGPPEMQAMLAGDLDVAYLGIAPAIDAISQGLDAKIVAAVNVNGSDLVFRTGKDYQSPSSLEGLTIATFPPGSIQDTMIKKWLIEHNVDLSKVTILPMGPEDAVAAIEAGKVDGVFLPQPLPAIIELDGKGKSVVASGEMWPNHACCSLVISGKLIRDQPELAEQIIKTHINATNYLNAHPMEGAMIYANRTHQDLKQVEYSIETWDGRWISDPHIQVPSAMEYAKIIYEMNYTKKEMTEKDLFDNRFYDRANNSMRGFRATSALGTCMNLSRPIWGLSTPFDSPSLSIPCFILFFCLAFRQPPLD